MHEQPLTRVSKASVVWLLVFTAAVGSLWILPSFWYSHGTSKSSDYAWFAEQSIVRDWTFERIPVGKAAEAVLVADKIVNGEFKRADGRSVQVYSAKRYLTKENEIGLFSHTPDRCWTAAGWNIEPVEPDFVNCDIHGSSILFERRIFRIDGQRQLVYFGALVGGKPLPYRIDQYFDAAKKPTNGKQGDTEKTWLRVMQPRLWSWAWESFVNRTPLRGPQQFIRITSRVSDGDIAAADQLLAEFLPLWLNRTEYDSELGAWKASMPNKQSKQE